MCMRKGESGRKRGKEGGRGGREGREGRGGEGRGGEGRGGEGEQACTCYMYVHCTCADPAIQTNPDPTVCTRTRCSI